MLMKFGLPKTQTEALIKPLGWHNFEQFCGDRG